MRQVNSLSPAGFTSSTGRARIPGGNRRNAVNVSMLAVRRQWISESQYRVSVYGIVAGTFSLARRGKKMLYLVEEKPRTRLSVTCTLCTRMRDAHCRGRKKKTGMANACEFSFLFLSREIAVITLKRRVFASFSSNENAVLRQSWLLGAVLAYY